MLRGSLLTIHIVAGVAGLLLGPATMAAAVDGGRHTAAGGAYHVAVAVLAATTVGLASLDWSGLWPFVLLAAGTEAAVIAGRRAGRRRTGGWLGRHVRLLGGSYVSLVTAVLVVSWGSVLAWVLPIVLGTVVVEVAAHRAVTGAAGAQRGAAATT